MGKSGKTLLYVDDEEINHLIFRKSFEENYDILTAISGEKGLEILKEHNDQIIVVISDMRMPIMNGVEFIKTAQEEYDDISYFIVTGYEYNTEIENALKNKIIQKYFTKPLDIQEIEDAIQETLDSH